MTRSAHSWVIKSVEAAAARAPWPAGALAGDTKDGMADSHPVSPSLFVSFALFAMELLTMGPGLVSDFFRRAV